MGFSPKLLGADEHVVVHMRTHAKALIIPALVLILVGAAVGIGAALTPASLKPVGPYVIIGLGVLLVIIWSVAPFLRWTTSTYTVTNRRVITRQGILNKTGKDLPLRRINDVSYERSLMDRILGCGTLNIQTASEGGPVVLNDVPDVERVHLSMTELLFGDNQPQPQIDGDEESEDDQRS